MESKTWVRTNNFPVGAAPVRIANHAPDRKSLLISNTGAVAITVGTEEGLVAGGGLELNPGGTASFTQIEDFALTRFEWFAISNGGASSVRVWQTVERTEGAQ